MNSIVLIPFGSPDYDAAYALRKRILLDPIGVHFSAAQLSEEYASFHLATFDAHWQLCACLLLTPLDTDQIQMRQVAVDKHLQRQGVGSLLVAASEKLAKQLGYQKITLHAQESAVLFYQKLNYQIEGEPFTEVGIPHRHMFKKI